MRLGLFGGSFDPPHIGHLLAASDAADALALDRVVFIPAAHQPLKPASPQASGADRVEMTRRLCADDPRFAVDPVEVDRGGLSYTAETLREYRSRHPDAEIFLLVGADAAASLPAWRETDAVRAMAEVVILTRDGPAGSSTAATRRVPTRRVDVSSTEVRERVRTGRPLVGLVTESVAAYIRGRGLYGAGGSDQQATRRQDEKTSA